MSGVAKIATELGLAILVGLLFVSVIQPRTPRGRPCRWVCLVRLAYPHLSFIT